MALGRYFRLSQKLAADFPVSLILENTKESDEFILFESGIVATLKSAECEDFKKQYEKVLDCYGCLGILRMNEENAQYAYLCLVTACLSVGKLDDFDVFMIRDVLCLPMWVPLHQGIPAADDKVAEIQKLISSGTFYFAVATTKNQCFDLTLCSQKRFQGLTYDHRFFWNRRLHIPFQKYGVDVDRWLLRCICGGVEIKTVYVGNLQARACVISRLSCERMGTRFNVRGTNDSGHVANFVETEQVIFYDSKVASFVQTRGSVPLFWEQPGVQIGSHKVKFSRGIEASAPAFHRHFKLLQKYYGYCAVVNLLGNKEGEKMLSEAYMTQMETFEGNIPYIHFDYHNLVRQNNKSQNLSILWDKVKDYLIRCGFFFSNSDQILKVQTGQVRTNCLDCLDRTNCAQSFFGLNILSYQLEMLGLSEKTNIKSRFDDTFRQMWTSCGDQCSRIYAGTGALEGKSKLKDASRSVTRTIQNNLMDGSKQEAMDLFLLGTNLSSDFYELACSLLPVDLMETNPSFLSAILKRSSEFTTSVPIRIFCGTWNVNGGQRLSSVVFRREASLANWLLNFKHSDLVSSEEPIDIYAIGLEEIVDLNASNIMNASSVNHRMWNEELLRVLSRDRSYILLTSLQLVGVCLFVYIRPHLAPFVRDLATDSVKTGLGGAAGNKGAVSMRFLLYSTPLCFLCSHFAAGQSQIQERNSDYQEICRKIQFPLGRHLFSHDLIFWIGDFNYRIDINGDDVKQLIKEKSFNVLKSADQLTNQKLAGNVFVDFNEGQLNFPPTYKYDTFSDDYDTSEKCRSPAWTDRILWWQKANGLTSCSQTWYNRVELKTSDHRPVCALFSVDALQVDDSGRRRVLRSVFEDSGPADSTVVVTFSPPADAARMVDRVLEKTSQLSLHILLVKFVNDQIWLILGDGHMALAALSMDGAKLDNSTTIKVRLKSEDWQQQFEKDFDRLIIDDKLDPKFADDFSTDQTRAISHIATNLSCNDLENIDFSVENEPPLSTSNSSSNLKVPPKRPPPPKTSPQAPTPPGRERLETEIVIPTLVSDDDWSYFVADRQQQMGQVATAETVSLPPLPPLPPPIIPPRRPARP